MKQLTMLAIAIAMSITSHATKIKLHVSIKHGSNGQCVGEGSCRCPLGICISRGFEREMAPLTPAEISDGIGSMTAEIVSVEKIYLDPPYNTQYKMVGKLRLIFDQQTATDDGGIPIDGDSQLSTDVATSLGYGRIVILGGNYPVVSSHDGQYGETLINCVMYAN